MAQSLLVIEDDPAVRKVLGTVAVELGLRLDEAQDGENGLARALAGEHEIVVLDLGLPRMGGIEVCKRLRSERPMLPIIILTSRDDELSKVLGLELGADDYVTKPFSMVELTARIRTILRRRAAYLGVAATGAVSMTIGDLTLNPSKRELTKAGEVIVLTKTEFEIIYYFFSTPGVVVSRDELTEYVWGYNCTGFDATVTTYLSRLRSKIEDDPDSPRYLRTVRGVGYCFDAPNAD